MNSRRGCSSVCWTARNMAPVMAPPRVNCWRMEGSFLTSFLSDLTRVEVLAAGFLSRQLRMLACLSTLGWHA
eukprot:496354-Alexandrium_andersonii.AAC.1